MDERRDVLRGRGGSVDQLGMCGVVEDLAQARSDLLLLERPDGMAGRALLAEQLLAGIGFALLLVLLNGCFVAAEFALVRVRPTQLARDAATGMWMSMSGQTIKS